MNNFTPESIKDFKETVDKLLTSPDDIELAWSKGICYMLSKRTYYYDPYIVMAYLLDDYEVPNYGTLTDERKNILILLSLLSIEEILELTSVECTGFKKH